MITSPFPAPEWVHFSNLKHIARSPAHYFASLWPREESKRASPRLFGALTHARTLGRGDFVVFDGPKRSGKKWDKFKADNIGKEVCTAREWWLAGLVAHKLLNHPRAAPLLEGEREGDVEWRTHTGRKAAGRLDVVRPLALTELKTCFSADPIEFTVHAQRMNYVAQGGWYRCGLEQLGREIQRVDFVVVEPFPPYAITTMHLSARALEQGRTTAREWIDKLFLAETSKRFPEYADDDVELDVPAESPALYGFADDDGVVHEIAPQ